MKIVVTIFFVMLGLNLFAEKDSTFTRQERKVIDREVACIQDSIVQKFEHTFAVWKRSLKMDERTKFSSNTRDFRMLKEYKELLDMGEGIIPLIVKKMMVADEGNFIGLLLYDALQTNQSLILKSEKSEQDRAIETVKLWVKSKK